MAATKIRARVLRLHLKACYWDDIAAGTKPDEYRLCTPYWEKRLAGKVYDGIELLKGYPKRGDTSRTMARPWRGYVVDVIEHLHFGDAPVRVFAIRVN